MPPAGDLAHNLSLCPDWELNRRPFGSQAGTQSTEPHQPGPKSLFLIAKKKNRKGFQQSVLVIQMLGKFFPLSLTFLITFCLTLHECLEYRMERDSVVSNVNA